MSKSPGAHSIAQALRQLGVEVIFGLVGIPVVQIAEEAIALGIRFVAFRNEQAASYAATAYGYLTGRPGVCLVVGGPGVLHAMAGIGNSSANAFPMLLLAGSCETHLVTRGAFQELDAVTLLMPHVKFAVRPGLDTVSRSIAEAYRTSFYGRGGTSFVDLPADVIQGKAEIHAASLVPPPPRLPPDQERMTIIARMIKSAKAPLIVIGKGAAYARAENSIRCLINETMIPFLPTPMGKGVVPDSHPSNVAAARSSALKHADIVLLLGARLNWILHFGDEPKWNAAAKFIQVDSCIDEIGRGKGDPNLGIHGDINDFASGLVTILQGWKYNILSSYVDALKLSIEANSTNAAMAAKNEALPMTYHRTFSIIKETLHKISPPIDGNVVFISEGANTMDIARSVFPVEHPRLRLDAGTNATMGVGLGYAIAAHCAYNLPSVDDDSPNLLRSRKKIVCIEGDSAFGFSMAEIETMARNCMDVLIFVINNGGIYHGDSMTGDDWLQLQARSREGANAGGLRSTSLGWEVKYEKAAEMCGGIGYFVRTPDELERATREGFAADVPVIVNVIIEAGLGKKLVSKCSFPFPNK